MKFGGGGATRKTAPDSDLTISHSEDKDNLSPKIEEFYEKMIRHSGPDPESINADKNRLRLGGRSDKGGKIIPSSFRHPELDWLLLPKSRNDFVQNAWFSTGSIKIGKDSGKDSCSEAGMTKISSNNLRPAGQTDNTSRKAAFTLAEVLITLGIIGIVAAMTLPTLIVNHRKQVALTKIKHTYNILSNALERAKVDYDTEVNSWYIPTSGSQLEKSMFFVETYMLPYLQVLHYCKDEPTEPYCLIWYGDLNGAGKQTLGPRNSNFGTAFVLNNGAVVEVTVGALSAANEGDSLDETISRVKITFDIDGPQGYNKKGYDVFMIELGGAEGPNKKNNADRNKFLPYIYDTSKDCDYYVSKVNHGCNKDATYGGSMCLAYIVCNGWDFGDKYPW